MLTSVAVFVGLGGLVVGAAFGFLSQRTNFCTAGAMSDLVLMQDARRMRGWLLAIAVALLLTQAFHFAAIVDLNQGIYRSRPSPIVQGLGGFIFGLGMALAGGCASRTLVRIGGGNLAALAMAAVIGAVAFMTLRGPLAQARLALEQRFVLTELPAGVPLGGGSAFAIACLIALGLMVFCFKDAAFRRRAKDVGGGIGVGLAVALGWIVTSAAGDDGFDIVPTASLTFVGPLDEAARYLLHPGDAKVTFGIASALGVIIGGLIGALSTRGFRLHLPRNAFEWARQLGGAALMGFGGVLALGCSIGQGVTGIATLSTGSAAAFAGMLLGSFLGVRTLFRVA